MKRCKSFFILVSIVLFSCSVKTEQENKDYYNLAFSGKDLVDGLRWVVKVTDDTSRVKIREVIDGDLNVPVLCLTENELFKGKRIPLSTVLSQQFPLYRSFKKADITVRIKAESLEKAWLKAESLDIAENSICRDSVAVFGDGWQDYHLEIPLDSVSYIWLSFDVKGKPCKDSSGAKIFIHDLDIRFDGLSVNVAGRPEKGILSLDAKKILPLSFAADSLVGGISFPENGPCIIGLGETMHGSKTLGLVKNQLIRWLVLHRDCKLILVELPTFLLLKWDLYAQGYPVNLEEILEDLSGALQDRDEVAELLNFLKNYNKGVDRKVHIAGMDRSISIEYFPFVHDYFYEMYKQKSRAGIYDILKTNFFPDSILPLFTKTELAADIGKFEFEWFTHMYWLKLMENHIPGVKENGTMNYRDYIMWRYVYYALKAINLRKNECAVITGHWSHMNKWNVTSTPSRSLGYYLKESYGDKYCAIGLLGGEGSYYTYRIGSKRYICCRSMTSPTGGSLEKTGMETGMPYFYYSTFSLPEAPVNIRHAPAGSRNQSFRAFNIPKRMDSFIFVRDCEAGNIPLNQRSVYDYRNMIGRRFIRMLKRNQELNITIPK